MASDGEFGKGIAAEDCTEGAGWLDARKEPGFAGGGDRVVNRTITAVGLAEKICGAADAGSGEMVEDLSFGFEFGNGDLFLDRIAFAVVDVERDLLVGEVDASGASDFANGFGAIARLEFFEDLDRALLGVSFAEVLARLAVESYAVINGHGNE